MDSNYLFNFKEYPYGMYACIDKDNNIVIGEDNPRDGGNLYAGNIVVSILPILEKL